MAQLSKRPGSGNNNKSEKKVTLAIDENLTDIPFESGQIQTSFKRR